jgi:ATP-dependent DNA ligase
METLYNISPSTHRIKQWKISVNGNKITIEHGFLDSKQVIHEQICEGKNIGKKNETTPEQQALLEAKSQWDKKLKSGYVTYDKIKDTSNASTMPSYFPMLATEYSEKLDKTYKFPCYAQPKLDGIRCIVFKHNNEIIFQSRNNTIFQSFPRLLMELNLLFLKNPKLILDGELYHHELGFQKITSIVRKKDHPELSKIQYHIYDIIDTSKTYEERYQELSQCIKNSISVFLVNTTIISSKKEMNDLHKSFVNQGYEGIMLRNPLGLYKQQIRSKDLIKYKLFKDADYVIVGHHEGTGGIPVFECINNENKKFSVNMKCSLEEKREIMENIQHFYGKKLIVKYQELSEDGIPRFPVCLCIRAD